MLSVSASMSVLEHCLANCVIIFEGENKDDDYDDGDVNDGKTHGLVWNLHTFV